MQDTAYAKVCTKCGQAKPLSEYYVKRERGRERLFSHCKACHRRICRDWASRNRDLVRERSRRYDKGEMGERRREQLRAWRQANPQIQAAYNALNQAIARGDVIRPDTCDQCDMQPGLGHDGRALVQAHHDDYSRPLDVRWLCASCHMYEHGVGETD